MSPLYCIALTHRHLPIEKIGLFHIADEWFHGVLSKIKENYKFEELLYLCTCNRVEIYYTTANELSPNRQQELLLSINPAADHAALQQLEYYTEIEAARHLFEVASSINSLVVGEREIITQVRTAYEKCNRAGFTGDVIRLAVKQAILTAKEIYTHTQIASKPVSVVSLAYRYLTSTELPKKPRVLIIGAGQTNMLMAKFLKKHTNFQVLVFNRTLEKASKLAQILNGQAYSLEALKNHHKGFDLLIACTGAGNYIVDQNIYTQLLAHETSSKVIIDLSVPTTIDPQIKQLFDVDLMDMQRLQDMAAQNIVHRKKELSKCNKIIESHLHEFEQWRKERKVEIAMRLVPEKIKEITSLAMHEVFAGEIAALDEDARKTIEKVVEYLEKKYISMPMKMAKEILLTEL